MKYLAIVALGVTLVGCTTQTGVRTTGSPHMVNKATGNAIIAVMIKDFEATQDAAKAQTVDALKGSVAAAGNDADSKAALDTPKAPEAPLDAPQPPLSLED